MSAGAPTLVLLSDQLEFPPRLGYHVHLLGLARAAAPRVAAKAFCWARAADDAPAHVEALDPARAPRGRLARKRRYVAQALAWMRQWAGPGSVLWFRGYTTAALTLLGLPARERRARGWTTVYDVASLAGLEAREKGGRLPDLLRAYADERLWARCDRVRTLCAPMADYLVGRGLARERVLVIPVGSEARTESWSPRPRPHRLLYVGSAMGWQGLTELFEAMRRLEARRPDLRLDVYGVGLDELSVAPPRPVELHGRVPHAEIAAAYLESDLFVLPRPRTALTELVVPMKIPEAMAFGIPILATDLSAVRWMTGEDGAILTPGGDPASLAAAIDAALADPARLAAVGRRARERAQCFTWEAIGGRIEEQLFGGGRAPCAG